MYRATPLLKRHHFEAWQRIPRAVQMRIGGAQREQDGINLDTFRRQERGGKSIGSLHQAMVMRTRTFSRPDAA